MSASQFYSLSRNSGYMYIMCFECNHMQILNSRLESLVNLRSFLGKKCALWGIFFCGFWPLGSSLFSYNVVWWYNWGENHCHWLNISRLSVQEDFKIISISYMAPPSSKTSSSSPGLFFFYSFASFFSLLKIIKWFWHCIKSFKCYFTVSSPRYWITDK